MTDDKKVYGVTNCEKCGEAFGWHSQPGGMSIAVHECSKPAGKCCENGNFFDGHDCLKKPASPAREWTAREIFAKWARADHDDMPISFVGYESFTALQEKLAVAEEKLNHPRYTKTVDQLLDAANKRIAELADMIFVHDKRASENLQEANELRVERDRYRDLLARVARQGLILGPSLREDIEEALNPSGGADV